MTTIERNRTDNPRWLAALVTAFPVALAVLLIGLLPTEVRRSPAAEQPGPIDARPASANSVPHAEPNPDMTVARMP